jgi:hypothetical protein
MFNIFASFSSPHLGYMYNPNKLIDAGFYFLIFNKIRNVVFGKI